MTYANAATRQAGRIKSGIARRARKRFWQLVDFLISRTPIRRALSPNLCAAIAESAARTVIDDRQSIHRFWSQSRPLNNVFPQSEWSPRSQTIVSILDPYVTRDVSILELGCNAGRNLNHLYNAGFHNLGAIELSSGAVQRLRSAYPALRDVRIDIGPAEEMLTQYGDGAFDVVFTMAVIEHIHPDSKNAFAEIARVAARYVLAIEPRDGSATHRQYPWNVAKEYRAVGLELIELRSLQSLWPVEPTPANEFKPGLASYDAMLFRHVAP